MEKLLNLHIERLPEGYYLATSDTIQGLVAQGRTVNETIEIARDIAKKLIEAQSDGEMELKLTSIENNFDYLIIVGI